MRESIRNTSAKSRGCRGDQEAGTSYERKFILVLLPHMRNQASGERVADSLFFPCRKGRATDTVVAKPPRVR